MLTLGGLDVVLILLFALLRGLLGWLLDRPLNRPLLIHANRARNIGTLATLDSAVAAITDLTHIMPVGDLSAAETAVTDSASMRDSNRVVRELLFIISSFLL